MKSIYINLIIICLINLGLDGYCQIYPIPASGSQWGCTTMLGPPGLPGAGIYGDIERYEITDTIIQNVTYQHWAGEYTRYVNNRLLLLDVKHSTPDSLIETVYYDFNLAVNDSFLINRFNEYAIVEEVSTFQTLNGQTRKRILLRADHFTCINRLEWIEGIGDISNSVFYVWQLGTCDIYRKVVCFSDSLGDVYLENGFSYPCDSLDHYVKLFETGAANPLDVSSVITAYPNPFSDRISVEMTDLTSFRSASLYTMSGIMVETTKDTVIQTAYLKPGVYFLKVEFEAGIMYYKMIKN